MSLHLKIPPPIVGGSVALLMWGCVEFILPPNIGRPEARFVAVTLLSVIGVSFDMTGLMQFFRAHTTINPMRPTASTQLVTHGVYRITRNPMYLGMLCLLLAWAIYLWSVWALLGPIVFVAYITFFQIKPEERILTERFGNAFTTYQRQVRRWL